MGWYVPIPRFGAKVLFWAINAINYGVLTMTSKNADFQIHLYQKPYIPFERSQKVI